MIPQRKQAFKLALAEFIFGEARAGIHELRKLASNEHVYHTLAAGIIVTYMRPFMSAENLGSLSPKFLEFPTDKKARNGQTFAELHSEMDASRNQIFAHFDIEGVRKKIAGIPNGVPPEHLILSFRNGNIIPTVGSTMPSLDFFDAAYEMIEFQQIRAMEELRRHLTGWLGTLPSEGSFEVTNEGLKEPSIRWPIHLQ